jgi:hypothetical protein
MGDLADEMWPQAADSWYRRDRSAATLAGRGREMDGLYDSLAAKPAAGQVTVPAAMEMALVALLPALGRALSTSPGGPPTSPEGRGTTLVTRCSAEDCPQVAYADGDYCESDQAADDGVG